MNIKLRPSSISGEIFAPSSKSTMQRALAAALFTDGISEISYNSLCKDTLALVSVIENLGAKVESVNNKFLVRGGFNPINRQIDCGESGLCARLFASLASFSKNPITLTGQGSLMKRNLALPEDEMKLAGIKIESNNGFLPCKVSGPASGGKISIDGSQTSQVLSGLLMALPLAENDSEVIVSNLQSKPYIDLTINMLSEFGILIFNENYERFVVKGKQKYRPARYTAEGDWSGAAFFLVAGAIAGEITVRNLSVFSKQADRMIIEALKRAGAELAFSCDGIIIKKNKLNAFEFDASDCPDLFPPLAVLAAACSGESIIKGVNRLPMKESNRAESLMSELKKMGIKLRILNNSMSISGGTVQGAHVDSHNDHRIAMACGVLSLIAQGDTIIENAECVDKSYMEFWQELQKCSSLNSTEITV